jgi:hypothetical protein
MAPRLALVLAFLAATAAAAGDSLAFNTPGYAFDNCPVGGSTAQTVPSGRYLLRIFDSDVWVCWASTCVAGGERFVAGSMVLISVGSQGQAFSCRSAASTGDLVLTGVQP